MNDLHDDLRKVVRDVLAPTSPLATGGDGTAADWQLLAELGWLGLEVPEALGGSGASFAEVAVVLEELGRAASASPFLGSVLAVGALLAVEPAAASDELLGQIAAGDARAALAHDRFHLTSGHLSGRATFVPDAASADVVLVVADSDTGPVVVEAEVAVEPTPVVDGTRSLATVSVDGEPRHVWSLRADRQALLDRAALAVAIDSIGIAQAALDATVEYAKVRSQFGRPIGSFQAVKHACANVAVELTISRRLVADAIERGGIATSMAKAHATETAVMAAGSAMQLHGGIGYTWESGIHALLKRATLNRSLFGPPARHRRRLSERYAPRG